MKGLERTGEEGCGDNDAGVVIRDIAKGASKNKKRDKELEELTSEALTSALREHIHRLRTQSKELGKIHTIL